MAVAACILLTGAGCASLPDAAHEMDAPHTQVVAFEGARGPVSESRSAAIIDELEGPSSVLQKHLDMEQTINADSPLGLGNKRVHAAGRPGPCQAMFARDLAESDAVDLERWEQRPLILRLKEGAARITEYWL
jgi:cardiolipin synthase